jgi:hypothetical protein
MPRLHLNLTSLDALQESDMSEEFEAQASHQKALRRPRDIHPESYERRLKERGKTRRRNQVYSQYYGR